MRIVERSVESKSIIVERGSRDRVRDLMIEWGNVRQGIVVVLSRLVAIIVHHGILLEE